MNVVPFNFDGASVRVVMRDGEPWFVAADVAAVLGYSETSAMVRSLDDYEKGAARLAAPSGSGEQTYVLVSESGLYSAVLRSLRPEAKRFRKWVTSEVLPSIRKTGGYSVNALTKERHASEAFLSYKSVAEAFGLSKNAALIAADNAVAKRYAISFKDDLGITLQAEDNEVPLLVSAIGAELGIAGGVQKRGKMVNDMLVGIGLQVRLSNGDWMPTEAGAPYAFVAQTGKKHKDGTPVTQVKWRSSIIPLIRRCME